MFFQDNKFIKNIFLFSVLIIFSVSFISSSFGYDNPNLPKITNPNVIFGNVTYNGNCLNGGAEIRSDGTICGQRLEVFNITSVNITFQNVTVEENFIIEGDIALEDRIIFGFGEMIDNLVNGWIKITGGLTITDDVIVGNDLNVTRHIKVEGNVSDSNNNIKWGFEDGEMFVIG